MVFDRHSCPLVSILTPSFNQGRWLGDNIASVANQTYPCVEHVVVDGGSTDESVTVLESASPRVRWVSEPDRGQSDAINKAFRLSRGEIIGWLNSDDAYFTSDAIDVAVREFERNPDAAVVYGHAALVNAEGLILHTLWVPPFSPRILRLRNFIVQPAAFIRRAAVAPLLADETFDYAMDRELWLRLSTRGRFLRVNRILAVDRHHPERKSEAASYFEVARNDNARLARTYDLPRGQGARAIRKVVKVAERVAGITLLGQLGRPRAFEATTDSMNALIRRQLFTPRRRMPAS